METSKLIDKRNFELWNSLRAIHEIDISRVNDTGYSAFSKNGKTVITVPFDDENPASFTHELLHVYLKTKEVFIAGKLTLLIKSNNELSKIFSNDLLDHIGNCLEHIKMLPEFIRLGYSENEFISDYYVNKLTANEIMEIKTQFISNHQFYNAQTIDFYIGKFFAANSCPNDSFSYLDRLDDLKKIDPDLYQILDTFLKGWITYDYNDRNPITGGYDDIAFSFFDNLEQWVDGKTVV